jgi:tyrosyl-tRNA synthetase
MVSSFFILENIKEVHMTREQLIGKIKKGAVNIYSEKEFDKMLSNGKRLVIKLGADPSRPDLHLGHSVVLNKLRLFQELGHKVVFVIGDFTGMIGDPTGKSKTRPKLTIEQTRESGKSYFEQVTKILDKDKTEIKYNSEWLSKMNFEQVIELASSYTLARIMERDDFKTRYKNNIPIGLHELLYPLVQGYDSVAIKADIEIGGTDQTFNFLVGRTLMERVQMKPQVVMTYPLLTGLDGKQKMSKSLDNYIGIDEPAYIMFEKSMKVPDKLLHEYFELTTDCTESEAEYIINKDIRQAHFKYADLIVSRYHSAEKATAAKKRYIEIASGINPDNIKEIRVCGKTIPIIELIKLAGFAESSSQARRNIVGKGIKLDGNLVEDMYLMVDIEDGKTLQFGKNKFARFILDT